MDEPRKHDVTKPFWTGVVKIALAFFEAWLKGRVDKEKWTEDAKAETKRIIDEAIAFLEPILGELAKELAPVLVKGSLKRLFPNDHTTGVWGA